VDVGSDVNDLVSVRLDREDILLALLTAMTLSSEVFVVQREEVAEVPVACVWVGHGVLEAVRVVFDWDEEGAIVGLVHASLLLELLSPSGVAVLPWASIHLHRPWVARLHKLNSVGERNDSKSGVGMASNESVLALKAGTLDDVLFGIVGFEPVPQLCYRHVRVFYGFSIGANQAQGRVCGPTSVNSPVITMELSEGFLHVDWPEFFLWSHLEVSILVAASGSLWDEVIDKDRDGHTQGVHLDRVDSGIVELLLVEHVVNALGVLSDGGKCGEDPAVTKRALLDIVEGDTRLSIILEERVSMLLWEDA
jgi:hypothetical protein